MDLNVFFKDSYYGILDANTEALRAGYRPHSKWSWEGQPLDTFDEFLEKLKSLGEIKHAVKTVDVKPSSPQGSAIVLVTGTLALAGNAHELPFSEVFHIFPDTSGGGFFIENDIFRLNL
jgi:hypothetical protein